MFSLEIVSPPAGRDLLTAELWELGCAGIVELDEARVRVFFEDAAGRDEALTRWPGASWREEEETDWVATAREKLPPMLIGRRFFLVPEWRDDPTPEGRFRIQVNPGQAFGTGFHETTQLCIEALEDYCRPGMDVLDVGTGSGILSQAAECLGAARIYACDIDPIAVEVARLQLRQAFVGSADAVRPGIADIVVANITPEPILELAPDLLSALRPGGVALLSGFEGAEVELVKAAFAGVIETRAKGAWSALIVRAG
jgi:ribosomal protein L11 methyltransferase